MRLLLIAYEFPPSSSPQSLRWVYFCRELVLRGHEVHVLTIDLGGEPQGLPELPTGVHVHRSFAGPVRGMLAAFRERRHRAGLTAPSQDGDVVATRTRPPRNWKQSLSERVQAAASAIVFPDVRGEWRPWGKRALKRLLQEVRPDVVISSHEPATTLELGLLAKRAGFPWVADLGDPVLAPYTPSRWKDRALRLEREVCRQADHMIVTNAAAAGLLEQRHGRLARISVLTQGFDDRDRVQKRPLRTPPFDAERLELLYTGSFYSFRRPESLFRAVAENPAARLNIAAVTVPESVMLAAREMPQQVRLLGFLPHLDVLDLQKNADVLVNIANDDPAQIPGKFYEYLGATRPILHLSNQDDDAISRFLADSGFGWNCPNTPPAIAEWLEAAIERKRRGEPVGQGIPDAASAAAHGWMEIGRRLELILLDLPAANAT